MDKGAENNKLVIPLITSLFFISSSIISLEQGIENHKHWQVVLASVSGAIFLLLGIFVVARLIRNNRRSGI